MKKPKISLLMSLVFAEEKCSQALWDFLSVTNVGRISGVVEEAENSDHEESSDGGVQKLKLFFGGFFYLFWEKRTCNFAFVSLCYGRSGEENVYGICHGR
jgi:hypothetical protein